MSYGKIWKDGRYKVKSKRSSDKGHWSYRVGGPRKPGRKWFFRSKIKNLDEFVKNISMRKLMAKELWYWD